MTRQANTGAPRAIAILAAIALAFALGTPSASAVNLHPALAGEPFGPDGTPGTSFNRLKSVTFALGGKRLYALSSNGGPAADPNAIYGFDASTPGTYTPLAGFNPLAIEPLNRPALTVDNSALASAGDIYLTTGLVWTGGGFKSNASRAFGYSPAASALPGWPLDSPPAVSAGYANLAVNPTTGEIWISDPNASGNGIHRYTSAGAPLPDIDLVPETAVSKGSPNDLAFDSNGDLYVNLTGNSGQTSGIYKLTAPNYEMPKAPFLAGLGGVLAVDTSTHDLYVVETNGNIKRYSPNGTLLEEFGGGVPSISDLTIDSASGEVFVAGGFVSNEKIYRFPAIEFPLTTTGTASNPSETSVTLNGTVRPDGVALSDCHFEYVTEAAFLASGFTDLSSGGSLPCTPAFGSIPADSNTHAVSATASGLSQGTTYRFRLVAGNANGLNPGKASESFEVGKPTVETVGSPIRSATTAHLEGRVNAHGEDATYRFEYGTQGPCDANPCEATEAKSAGSSGSIAFVSQLVEGLEPNTTYHYRVVAENTAGTTFGDDMTVTTRASDAPLSHGHLPGPPGSDRAYELVSLPDAGGNPVAETYAVADSGERVVYQVRGGNPSSNSGNNFNQFFAQRTSGGWLNEDIFPTRDELVGSAWFGVETGGELGGMTTMNTNLGVGDVAAFHLAPGQPAQKLYQLPANKYSGLYGGSDDGSLALMVMKESQDPEHPVAPETNNLYDVSSGVPHLVDLLPDGSVAACGIVSGNNAYGMGNNVISHDRHWIAPDGSWLLFASRASSCLDQSQLYLRDRGAEETKLVSGPPVSGEACGAALIRSTEDAVFFWTKSRLDGTDTAPSGGCGDASSDGDVYRYDLGDGSLECVTCVVPGSDADIFIQLSNGEAAPTKIAVAPDGSRVYFSSPHRLLPGAAADGSYRVDVATGDLTYVGPAAVGELPQGGNWISADGSVLTFSSSSSGLNAIGGAQNGGRAQLYRYDDKDRSLICISCPQGDSAAQFAINGLPSAASFSTAGPNIARLSADGATFAFTTSSPLLSADQNTAGPTEPAETGTDVYEWRDGRLFLVTDGLTTWANSSAPTVEAVSRSGKDLFFIAAAKYTQDAIDDYPRLYDARIGGGFEFPPPPKPCPLEVCQGTPKGAPEERVPGTGTFSGPGNQKPQAKKKAHKKKSHKKAHKHKHHSRANRDRRTAR